MVTPKGLTVDIWMLSIGILMTDSGLLCEDERVTFSCEVWRFPEPYNVFAIQAEVLQPSLHSCLHT